MMVSTQVSIDCSVPPAEQVAEVSELGTSEQARQGAAAVAAHRLRAREREREEILEHLRQRAGAPAPEPLTTRDLSYLLTVLGLDR